MIIRFVFARSRNEHMQRKHGQHDEHEHDAAVSAQIAVLLLEWCCVQAACVHEVGTC
jgi:hypothetical protein